MTYVTSITHDRALRAADVVILYSSYMHGKARGGYFQDFLRVRSNLASWVGSDRIGSGRPDPIYEYTWYMMF